MPRSATRVNSFRVIRILGLAAQRIAPLDRRRQLDLLALRSVHARLDPARDDLRRLAPDPGALLDLRIRAFVEAGVMALRRRRRTAVIAADEPVVGQRVKVPADGFGGHLKLVRQLADAEVEGNWCRWLVGLFQ